MREDVSVVICLIQVDFQSFCYCWHTLGESMGNVPRLHRPSQNLLKLSGFVELDELIILV